MLPDSRRSESWGIWVGRASAARESDLSGPLLKLVKQHGKIEKFVTYDDYQPVDWVMRTAQEDASAVRVWVRDAGVGCDEQDVEGLFAPFTTTKAKGMGMGLAISRSIVEVHGGKIWAENNADRGATFHFTLPVEASA